MRANGAGRRRPGQQHHFHVAASSLLDRSHTDNNSRAVWRLGQANLAQNVP